VTFAPADLEALRRVLAGPVLVSTHIHPDPDAIGSVLAAREMLLRLGAEPVVVLQDPVPARCRFLPGADHIISLPRAGFDRKFAAALILDAGNRSRVGDAEAHLAPGAVIVNVDHHLSNDRFGALNLVDSECAATCEMLFLLCGELGVPVTPSLANNLFAGLLTDTGRFRYSNTTARALTIAAALAEAGAEITRITNNLYFDVAASDVLSMSAIYSTLELFADGRLSTMFVRLEHLVEDPDSVVDLGLSVRGVVAAALLSETLEGKIRVSLRARHTVNVAAIAERFGGGGHEKAAGFRMKGTLESVRATLLPVLEAALTPVTPVALGQAG
jgi:bifunctional oligoribonuclease and PAP phosphatase NrnA